MDVLKLLNKDHGAVRGLFDKFDGAGQTAYRKKYEIFEQIRRELQLHMKVEEEIFYSAIKAANGEGRRLITEALREHRDIDDLLTQISRLKPENVRFAEKVEALIDQVDHHIEEEEGEIFRFAEENCSEDELLDLANQLEGRKKELERRMAA